MIFEKRREAVLDVRLGRREVPDQPERQPNADASWETV
jgi:hypothetical protein